jgi:hypothetical protein
MVSYQANKAGLLRIISSLLILNYGCRLNVFLIKKREKPLCSQPKSEHLLRLRARIQRISVNCNWDAILWHRKFSFFLSFQVNDYEIQLYHEIYYHHSEGDFYEYWKKILWTGTVMVIKKKLIKRFHWKHLVKGSLRDCRLHLWQPG